MDHQGEVGVEEHEDPPLERVLKFKLDSIPQKTSAAIWMLFTLDPFVCWILGKDFVRERSFFEVVKLVGSPSMLDRKL